MKREQICLHLLLTFMLSGCLQKFSIPEDINSDSSELFFAGDTSFLELKPLWDSEFGIIDPTEISIAQDGRIFIADSSNHSIFVLDQNGEKPDKFSTLKNLRNENGSFIAPIDVDIDEKMNIFFIDGTEKVYVWNQYWNHIGIEKVSTSGSFRHMESGEIENINSWDKNWVSFLNDTDWMLVDTVFSNDQSIIDSISSPYIFYDGSLLRNNLLDAYYDSGLSEFSGITSPAGQGNFIILCDDYTSLTNKSRILEVVFKKSLLIELKNGQRLWCFTGAFGSTIKGFGTGAGTVNRPLSIDVDYEGNLYYTQAGNFFPVHKIVPNFSGDFAVYSSGFQPGNTDITDSEFFSLPMDIAIDKNKYVYIADSNKPSVKVFDPRGKFFKELGLIESGSTFKKPVAVTVDNRGVVYVCDKDNKAILRFKLSNSLDEDLILDD